MIKTMADIIQSKDAPKMTNLVWNLVDTNIHTKANTIARIKRMRKCNSLIFSNNLS